MRPAYIGRKSSAGPTDARARASQPRAAATVRTTPSVPRYGYVEPTSPPGPCASTYASRFAKKRGAMSSGPIVPSAGWYGSTIQSSDT